MMQRIFLRVWPVLLLLTLAAAGAPSLARDRGPAAPASARARFDLRGDEHGSGVRPSTGDIVRAPVRTPGGADAIRADALSRAIRDQVNMARRARGRQVLLQEQPPSAAQSCARREVAGRGRSYRLAATPV